MLCNRLRMTDKGSQGLLDASGHAGSLHGTDPIDTRGGCFRACLYLGCCKAVAGKMRDEPI